MSAEERYLVDEYTLTNISSASTLRFIEEKRKPDKPDSEDEDGKLLALGNPTTTSLSSLPFAAQEASRIAEIYETEALLEDAASETMVRQQAAQAEIIHFAAHGEYNVANPSFSTVHLAADEANDGRLEVHELYGLDLTEATNLVVLSACETLLPNSGLNQHSIGGGDEIVALNRAFLYAGTPSVIASLWNVGDEATGLLMERFYTHLRAGYSKADALRQAQQDLRNDEQYAHPYYWAAFVLTGDGGESSPDPFDSWTWLIVGAIVVNLILLAFVSYLKRKAGETRDK